MADSAREMELGFVSDLVAILKDDAAQIKLGCKSSGSDFDSGRHFAYFEVLLLIQEQAKSWQIDLASVGLEEFDPYKMLG